MSAIVNTVGKLARNIEALLFILVTWYDLYVYTPIQKVTSPVVSIIPRTLVIKKEPYTVFTANIVSWARTLLIVPVAICLKYGHFLSVFWLVVLHDFLDHVDGIVAKVQKQIYGPIDDPLLGGFMDAFCDKIVNVTCLWTILMVTDFSGMSKWQTTLFIASCLVIIVYEFTLGVVRVQDFFYLWNKRHHAKKRGREFHGHDAGTKAVMEGKLKEKLESLGIAFLGLAQTSPNALEGWAGKVGVACLLLSVRLAHASLCRKLDARKKTKRTRTVSCLMATIDYHPTKDFSNKPLYNEDGSKKHYSKPVNSTDQPENGALKSNDVGSVTSTTLETVTKDVGAGSDGLRHRLAASDGTTDDSVRQRRTSKGSETSSTGSGGDDSEQEKDDNYRLRRRSLPMNIDGRVDKVFTVGCFDLFHRGHIMLLQRMREIGKQVIVGLHDSRSYFNLKNKVPIDTTEKRMLNVKQYADQVYCISSTDPSNFISCIVHLNNDETALYVRGDDMPNFPSRSVVESLMPVRFLPYTQGISSSRLRKELFAKIQPEAREQNNNDSIE